VATLASVLVVVAVVFALVIFVLVRRGKIPCGRRSESGSVSQPEDVETTRPGNYPYAIPRAGRLWLGKASLAAYDPESVYTLPPGFERNESPTNPAPKPRSDHRDASSSVAVRSRLMPLDVRLQQFLDADQSSSSQAHSSRIPRPNVFNVGSSVGTHNRDLSSEFFCNLDSIRERMSVGEDSSTIPSRSSASGSRYLHRTRNRFLPVTPLFDDDDDDDSLSGGGSLNVDIRTYRRRDVDFSNIGGTSRSHSQASGTLGGGPPVDTDPDPTSAIANVRSASGAVVQAKNRTFASIFRRQNIRMPLGSVSTPDIPASTGSQTNVSLFAMPDSVFAMPVRFSSQRRSHYCDLAYILYKSKHLWIAY
jgi:hypothetical protein